MTLLILRSASVYLRSTSYLTDLRTCSVEALYPQKRALAASPVACT